MTIDRVKIVSGDTGRTPNEGQTAGSLSIQDGGRALRKACAELLAAPEKPASRYGVVGSNAPRLDLPAKLAALRAAIAVFTEQKVEYALIGGLAALNIRGTEESARLNLVLALADIATSILLVIAGFNLARFRLDWSFTPRMFLNAFVQYNGEADAWLSNIRFNLIHRPLSDIYVVWNETRSPADVRRALMLKYTHLIAF